LAPHFLFLLQRAPHFLFFRKKESSQRKNSPLHFSPGSLWLLFRLETTRRKLQSQRSCCRFACCCATLKQSQRSCLLLSLRSLLRNIAHYLAVIAGLTRNLLRPFLFMPNVIEPQFFIPKELLSVIILFQVKMLLYNQSSDLCYSILSKHFHCGLVPKFRKLRCL